MTDDARRSTSKELDHIVPLIVGGAHSPDNARIICKRCNAGRPLDGSDVDASLLMFAVAVPPRLCACGSVLARASETSCSACRAWMVEKRRHLAEIRSMQRSVRRLIRDLEPPRPPRPLGRGASKRAEILELYGQGLGYKRIARELGITRHDARDQIRRQRRLDQAAA
jgi:hypothetical protein